jgi:hypothetical protein
LASLPAPTNFTATVVGDEIVFDWDDVVGATKYSVDVEATVTYVDASGNVQSGEVELSYGTSDRTDGGDMGDSDLTITVEQGLADLAAALGVDPALLEDAEIEAWAAVKALDPGKGKGRQNNPFSNWDEIDEP